MTGDEFGRVAYLVLLMIAVSGWFIAEFRTSLGRGVRQLAVWVMIFIGLMASYGLWTDIRDDVMPRQSLVAAGVVSVPRGPDGHYHLTLMMDGTPVDFVVDTGASDVVLTLHDAKRVGLEPEALIFSGRATTANGAVRTAPARIGEVRLGDIIDRNVPVSVNGGEMDGSLLGMSYLRRFARIEIADGELVLTR